MIFFFSNWDKIRLFLKNDPTIILLIYTSQQNWPRLNYGHPIFWSKAKNSSIIFLFYLPKTTARMSCQSFNSWCPFSTWNYVSGLYFFLLFLEQPSSQGQSREQARKDRKRDGLDNWLFSLLTHQFSVASSICEVSVKLNIL